MSTGKQKPLPPAALAKATQVPNPNPTRPDGPPPPKPAMPAALQQGDVLHPRATEVSKETLDRMQPGIAAAAQHAAAMANKSITSPLDGEPLTDDDAIGSTPTHPDAAVTKEAPPPSSTPETTAVVENKTCNYCGHDRDTQDIPECTTEDKVAFMSHLRGLDFNKSYPLLDGALEVEFRKLTVKELDAISSYLLDQMKRGVLSPVQDEYMEAYGRCRLYLQMKQISGDLYPEPLILPQGLNKTVNPVAETFYEGKIPEEGKDRLPATIDDAAEFAYKTYLTNESMQRIYMQALRDFNRLVSYMETNAPNPSFWKGTRSRV